MTRASRVVQFLALLLAASLCIAAQGNPAKLRIRVILIDKDLNQKPVPRLALAVRSLEGAGEPVAARTGFDGQAEVALPPGRYRISTPEPVEFQGKKYSWEMDVTLARAEEQVELTNDNAKVAEGAEAPAKPADDLATHFKRLQHSIVTVWSAAGRGTGFLVDPAGLVMTNQHVVKASEYLAVQFDDTHKFPARLLAADVERDVAVLWVNLALTPDAIVVPLAETKGGAPPVQVGERVFTIGNPFGQERVLTTGIVSKVDEKTITSDININPGNSGGPLFNSAGQAVGITTQREQSSRGAGLSGIVRIEQALPVLTEARTQAAKEQPPATTLLPVDPVEKLSAEAVRTALGTGALDESLYFFSLGEFDVGIYTPVLNYHLYLEQQKKLAKEREKRAKKSGAAPEERKEAEPEYRPHILILARPKLRVKASSLFFSNKMKFRFKTDFQKMRLLCGAREVVPIQPYRVESVVDIDTGRAQAQDTTFVGYYRYTHDAISPSCGGMTLELYTEAPDQPPLVKVLEPRAVERIWADFASYRSSLGTKAGKETKSP